MQIGVFTVTGVLSFDYFFSIIVWFLLICLPVCAGLILFARKFL